MLKVIKFLALFAVQYVCAMEYGSYSQSANVVASLKELAVLCVAKHCLVKEHQRILKLPLELQESLKAQLRWDKMNPSSFPVIPLPVKYASMSPDASTIAGIAQDSDGTNKLRFITINTEHEDKSYRTFSGDMFQSQDDQRFVNFAWHPTKQKLALVGGRAPNIVLIEAAANDLVNVNARITSERINRLNIFQWNPRKDAFLAVGEDKLFTFYEDSKEEEREICFGGESVITAASWSETGQKILIKLGLYGVYVMDTVQYMTESVVIFKFPKTVVAWDDEDENTILIADLHEIAKFNLNKRFLHDSEYIDPTSCIEQILRLNTRYLLIKTRQQASSVLKILDRFQKKTFNLPHVVCNGALTLSANKRFLFGSQIGDSLVDFIYLVDNHGVS